VDKRSNKNNRFFCRDLTKRKRNVLLITNQSKTVQRRTDGRIRDEIIVEHRLEKFFG